MIQCFTHPEHGIVEFTDTMENYHSRRCSAEDIVILDFRFNADEERAIRCAISKDIQSNWKTTQE